MNIYIFDLNSSLTCKIVFAKDISDAIIICNNEHGEKTEFTKDDVIKVIKNKKSFDAELSYMFR